MCLITCEYGITCEYLNNYYALATEQLLMQMYNPCSTCHRSQTIVCVLEVKEIKSVESATVMDHLLVQSVSVQ